MKAKLFKTMLCAGMAGTLLTGCMDDNVYNPDATKKQFEQNWKKQFGEIDPNQTWNTATRVTAKVVIGYEGNYTVEFYTENPRKKDAKAYLLGKFEVKGGETSSLQFDVPSTQQTVYVALVDENDGRIVKSGDIINENIDIVFGKNLNTRTIYAQTSGEIVVTESENYLYYGESLINQFLEIVPEDGTIPNGGKSNEDNVTPNFLYKSKGEFIIYPMYRISNSSDELGIYYYEGNERKEIKIWDNGDYIEFAAAAGNGIVYKGAWGHTSDVLGWTNGVDVDADKKLRCKGIKVSIPEGSTFGFYTTSGWEKTHIYTEKELNPGQQTYGATFEDKEGNLYFSFEDWIGSENRDFNDLVCRIEGAESSMPDVVDKDKPETSAQPWILACEDLGNTDDFDFNDIVFKVEHAAGSKTATVTPLAAGGVLAAEIYYGETSIGEIHEMLGASGLYITNTTNKGNAGTPETIEVPDDFSMTNNMGNFKIKIMGKDGKETEVTTVNAPRNGEAPQMICIDGSTNWAWPTERTKISDAYPGFGEWGANYRTDTDWYKNPVQESDSGHLNIVQ